MDLERLIKSSIWWQQAETVLDRHYDESSGIFIADHLNAVRRNVDWLLGATGKHEYVRQLHSALQAAGFDVGELHSLLAPVALLHDIGKPQEDKNSEGPHPITGEPVKMRHPITSLVVALEVIPGEVSQRETILALVEMHDTPFSWFKQFQKTQQLPKPKSWGRLDRKIDPRGDGTGLITLSVFKLADIDGHEDTSDVSWFIENANSSYLREKGKELPVPSQEAIGNVGNG